jgi:23S rRNA pseudouridine2605 synthase
LQVQNNDMAKKSTWEKRAKKVKKEEFLVLGGSTGKKRSTKPAAGKGKPKSTADSNKDGEGKAPRTTRSTGGERNSSRSASRRDDQRSQTPRSGRSANSSRSTSREGERQRDDSRPPRQGAYADRSPRPKRSFGDDEKGERRTRTTSDSRGPRRSDDDRGPSRAPRTRGKAPFGDQKFKSGPKGKKFNPSDFITRDGDDERPDRFKGKGQADREFRQSDRKKSFSKFTSDKPFKGFEKKKPSPSDGLLRLNKYLAMAGICSRREADTFIEQGMVSVNGKVVTELGTKVKPNDVVEYAGEKIKAEALRYILLNKPKDVITTLNDERGRSTVIGLVKNACKERVFPVGRLDRNTTGLILLTNDGDLADKLAHPSNEIRKVYHVITDKNVSIADLKKLETGVQLEDGIAKADAALFAGDGTVRNEIGLEIHSGRNRIVRRMFEALGYEVVRLDRAAFAGLSKKGLPRGRWRFLTDTEVGYLKML